MVNNLPAMWEMWQGDLGSIPGSGRSSWRRKWHPTPVLLPGESHGQRSLVDYNALSHRKSDVTEQFNNNNNMELCNDHHNPVLERFYDLKKIPSAHHRQSILAPTPRPRQTLFSLPFL